MQTKKGKIITVTSCKGGIGKSITTLNLAGVYSKMGLKTLVIDLDLYGGIIATSINSNLDRTIYNLVLDLTNNSYKQIEDYIYKYNDNISIIASPKDPRFASKIDSKYICLILNNCIYKYDVILLDTSHTLDSITITSLDNSDSILYMFTNDLFDLKNTKSFMSIIKDINYDNVYTLLNNSRDPEKKYFSNYDIRNIIKKNIDFTIDKSYYIKNIDKYIADGKILILNDELSSLNKKIYKTLEDICKKLIEK